MIFYAWEYKNNKPWNIIGYNKNGKVINKWRMEFNSNETHSSDFIFNSKTTV